MSYHRKQFKKRIMRKMGSRRKFYKTSRKVNPRNYVPRGGFRL